MKKNCAILGIFFLAIISSVNFAWALDELSNAAMVGDKVRLEALIANGADIKGEKGREALNWATRMGRREFVAILISRGVDVRGERGQVALSHAAWVGEHEIVAMLLAHGAGVNAQDALNGYMPLHVAVRRHPAAGSGSAMAGSGSAMSAMPPATPVEIPPMDITVAQNKMRAVEILIAHGADVNASSKYGVTPLHEVATREMAELLIKHGARVNARNKNDDTSLHHVINRDVAKVLIVHGEDVNSRNLSGRTALHAATESAKTEIVELLIAHNADVNAKDSNGNTALDIALQKNNVKLATLLLAHGSILSAKPLGGSTELHKAVSAGNKLMVELMLAGGARVNATDQNGSTPLLWAISAKNKEVAKLLIAHGADVNAKNSNGTLLIHVIHDEEMLELLLAHGAAVNAKDSHGNSLLWRVCYDMKLTTLLLKYGANINIKNSDGRTVLHLASRYGRDKVVKWLLAHGADVNAKEDAYGQTPLFHAVRSYKRYPEHARKSHSVVTSAISANSIHGKMASVPRPITSSDDLDLPFATDPDISTSKSIVKLLLAHGADMKAKDREGQSVLHVAPHKNIAKLLLANGLAVNEARNDGATPLHLAAAYGRQEVVQVLLARGAQINAMTKNGATPLHYAEGLAVAKHLIAKGAKVDLADNDGNTPLFMANEPEIISLLLASGAKLNERNHAGQTPLMSMIRTHLRDVQGDSPRGPLGNPNTAAYGGSIEGIQKLLDHGADVNLDDLEGYMPLFYVREAKKKGVHVAVMDLLNNVEKLLLEHGANLEKRKREEAVASQQNFPPELAEIPQIALGARVIMQVAVQYEERQKTRKENHLYYRESLAMPVTTDNSTFDNHLQLLDYFQNLPADVQQNGLWIKRLARNLWTQPDADRVDEITQYAKARIISLFLCEPKAPKNNSWLVSWDCDQISPQSGLWALSCEAIEFKGQPARWECRKKGN